MTARFLNSQLNDVLIENVIADAEKGGWEATLRAFQDTDAIVKWQAVALAFRYHSPEGWDEDERTALIGHALPQGLTFDFPTSEARFNVATSHRFLEAMSVQGIGFADQSVAGAAPYNDHQILNLRLGHIIEHILEEHSNISITTNPEGWVDTSDIDTTNSTRVNRYNFHATDNAWRALQQVARNEFYYLYFSKDNHVHYIPHPMFDAVLPTPVMEFTGDFCSGKPTVTLHAEKKVSTVMLKATDEDGTVYTSQYPATPAAEGRPRELTRIRVGGAAPQARLDALVRRVYDYETRDYTVLWPAPGWSGFFFELLDRVEVSYTGTSANGVHIDWSQKKFWIHRMQMAPGPAFTGQTMFTLEEEPTVSPAP